MNATKNRTEAAPGRRPLARLADDKMRAGTTPLLGRLLRETGRKSIEVAAFASSV
jgi:hypothetical protein